MKKKIIYISGGEVFSMADVRAAFDEVRGALNLGADTVLFGVPVDADDAIVTPDANVPAVETADVMPVVDDVAVPDEPVVADVPVVEPVMDAPVVDVVADAPVADADATDVVDIEPVAPEKPAPRRRGRTRKVADAEPVVETVAEPTPVVADDDSEPVADDVVPVVPILSVLASKAADAPDVVNADDVPADLEPDAVPDVASAVVTEFVATEIVADKETDADDDDVVVDAMDDAPADVSVAESISVEDMISDDAPVVDREKTLEELLESMAPLREDRPDAVPTSDDVADADISFDAAATIDDADATLEQLAAEFAENEDKIAVAQKTAGRGKIGKLKNILPFKKVKRDDTGLMGDLFGWAGIAANDDDFAIPGFFTTAASKN